MEKLQNQVSLFQVSEIEVIYRPKFKSSERFYGPIEAEDKKLNNPKVNRIIINNHDFISLIKTTINFLFVF